MEKREVGKKGEELALLFLKEKGYLILEENFRSPFGEIDIIAMDRRSYVFIEVKMRKSQQFGSPLESVTAKKQQRIIRTALFYLKKKGLRDVPIRFDVVSIEEDGKNHHIRLLKNAFEATGNFSY